MPFLAHRNGVKVALFVQPLRCPLRYSNATSGFPRQEEQIRFYSYSGPYILLLNVALFL